MNPTSTPVGAAARAGAIPGSTPMADPGGRRPRPAHGRAGRHDREHCAAVRAGGPGLHHHGPAVGGDRLRARVRQPAAVGRPAGRPDRPQGHVPGRCARLRRRVGRRRCGDQLRHAGRCARRPGRVRRAARTGGTVDPLHDVQRPEGARQGVRCLRRDRRRRRRGRPGARWGADRVPVVALVPVREPDPGGHRRDRRGAPAQAAARQRPAATGPARCRARLGVHVLPGLRILQRRDPPLGDAVDLRLPGRGRGAARRVRVLAGSVRPARCCRPGWCSTATAAAPTWPCSSPAPAWRACSCSSPTTCSRPWATRRWSAVSPSCR